MKKSLSQKLAENLAYFVNDPKKRCAVGGECKYSGVTLNLKTKGCFVGSLLAPKDRLLADAGGLSTSYELITNGPKLGIKLPKIVSENQQLMKKFQMLHDDDNYWRKTGLSDEGKDELKRIIALHDLEKKYFDKFW
jgi:hypothetical protein